MMKYKLLNPKHYLKEFKQLSKFAITPVPNVNYSLTIPQKIQGTWTMFVIKMMLAVIVGVSIGVLYDPENITKSNMAERFSPLILLLVSVLILPLFEEIAFRLSLTFKPIFLASSLGTLAYYVSSKAIYYAKLSDLNDHFEDRVIIAIIVLVIGYALFSIPNVKKCLEIVWASYFRWILYFFCFTFAWIHIFNYELTMEHLLMLPIITLPKLVSAFCYGYVRVNYGFIYSFAIHAINNSIGFIVSMASGSD